MSVSHAMNKYFESQEVINQFRDGGMSPQELEAYMTMAQIQVKLLAVEVAAQKVAASDNKTLKRLQNSGFISTASIPIAYKVEEMFPCPAHGNCMISRMDCLDYSGSENHIGTCQECEQFIVTRKYTMPK